MARKLTYENIIEQISRKDFAPVYLLMGEESYFIDLITDAILKNALDDSERDFNEIIRYGSDITYDAIINEAKFYPTFSQYRVVVIKEAQDVKKIEELVSYVTHFVPSTILVLNYKNGTIDGRKKIIAEIDRVGVIFESKKLYDNQIPAWISEYTLKKGGRIEPKASIMLADFIGQDLNRIVGEIDKLWITMPAGQNIITPDLVERNIGVSKEFNNFEFLNAIIAKDVTRSNRIANYFDKNPKSNPIILSLIVLNNYFSNLMLCHYLPRKDETSVMQGLRIPIFQAKNYTFGLRNYSALKTMEIISLIRKYDAKAKGVGSNNIPDGELLRELVFKILHN
ncbi:MAG: DNA polymerase III subunit delta [Bacteroidales bacterium]|nr:DNA polymerase III subunit delta [Bacteroidales bacterium]